MVQYSDELNKSYAALSDSTRRDILERLGRKEASISDLAGEFDMTLTGMKKHIQVLEAAGLVATVKVGRVRYCRLGSSRLEKELQWIEHFKRMQEARMDSLGEFLERTKGEEK